MTPKPHAFATSIPQATAALLSGGVGVMPTDTVYGLLARAQDRRAVTRLYQLKSRERKPGTIIAANVQQLVALGVPQHYLSQVKHLWPNPLSIVIPLGKNLDYLHQDVGAGALRVVADKQLQKLLLRTGPLLTSSANQPGQPSAANIQEAWDYFKNDVDFYVDGGDLSDRAPSTIIQITSDGTTTVLRDGAVKL